MHSLLVAFEIAQLQGEFGPIVSAKSAIIVDGTTGKPLWQHDAQTKRFPASTTKIMTALLLIEHCMPTDMIVAPKDVTKVPESSMHLKPGERVSVQDMLYAMMLRSANDACYAVAVHIGGSVERFAQMMNDRARLMGCKNAKFQNPNGLHNPNHAISASDMAIIAREAMKNPVFRDVVRTQQMEIERSINVADRLMKNKNRTLLNDPTADGIKTGYTNPAGKCFVGSATRDGYRLITTVFKSEDWYADNKLLLDWAFKHYQQAEIASPGAVVGEFPVANGDLNVVPICSEIPVRVLVPKGTQPLGEWRLESGNSLYAPLNRGQRIGNLVYRDSDGFEVKVPAYVGQKVEFWDASKRTGAVIDWGFLVIGGGLAISAIWMRKRARHL